MVTGLRFSTHPLQDGRRVRDAGGALRVPALAQYTHGRRSRCRSTSRPAGNTIQGLLVAANEAGQLVQTDIELASRAVLAAAGHDGLPVHLNLLAVSAAEPEDVVGRLAPMLRRTGRHAKNVVLEISAPFYDVRRNDLLAGIAALRHHGFRIALDGIGEGDIPLALLSGAAPDMLKIDSFLLAGLPDDSASVAIVEALAHLAARTNAQLAAVGVETVPQLLSVRRMGVRIAQGNVLASTEQRPDNITRALATVSDLSMSDAPIAALPKAPLKVRDFLHPAMTLPEHTTADEVRTALADRPDVNGVVLVDENGRPQWSIDRSRFLLKVTGPYGHALHAKRAAARHADPPRLISWDATGIELLDRISDADWERTSDDVVVIDEAGKCVGVVRVTEVIRGAADVKVEQAMTLSPLTRLPGSDAVAREVDRRIARGEMFVISWLDLDGFKSVNDSVGFAAGDNLIKSLGRRLSDSAAGMATVLVGHVGGDDFLLVTEPDEIAPLACQLVDTEWSVEGMVTSVSLASLACEVSSVSSFQDASKLLAPLKRHAKAVPGSSWVLGRPGSDRVEVLRGRTNGSHEHAVS